MVENKKLSDESLNSVSGGTAYETSQDSVFLHNLLVGKPGQCQKYGEFRIRAEDHSAEIQKAWESVGVDATLYSGSLFADGPANVYKIGGKTVSREDAIKHAMKVVGYHPEEWSF